MFAMGKITTDRDFIQNWAQDRQAWPAVVEKMGDRKVESALCFGFSDNGDRNHLREISWEEFFERFDRSRLVFVYQDEPQNGHLSKTYNFI